MNPNFDERTLHTNPSRWLSLEGGAGVRLGWACEIEPERPLVGFEYVDGDKNCPLCMIKIKALQVNQHDLRLKGDGQTNLMGVEAESFADELLNRLSQS